MKWDEQYAKKNEAFSSTKEWHDEALWVLDQLPYVGGRYLDVATSAGRLPMMAEGFGLHMDGMDVNEWAIEKARLRVPDSKFYTDLDEVPDGHYNTVTIMHALLQMKYPAFELLRVWDKLKPGGRLIMCHHNRLNNWLWKVPNLWNGYVPDETISHEFSLNETVSLAKDCGFVKVLAETYNGPWWLPAALRPKLRYIGRKPYEVF